MGRCDSLGSSDQEIFLWLGLRYLAPSDRGDLLIPGPQLHIGGLIMEGDVVQNDLMQERNQRRLDRMTPEEIEEERAFFNRINNYPRD